MFIFTAAVKLLISSKTSASSSTFQKGGVDHDSINDFLQVAKPEPILPGDRPEHGKIFFWEKWTGKSFHQSLLIVLDVKKHVNLARWIDSMHLENDFKVTNYLLRVIRDFLWDRTLLYSMSDKRQ